MKRLLLAALLGALTVGAGAQRTTDKLDRGLVAVPGASGGNFVSWKIFGEEYYDTGYNLYRDGVKVNDKPLTVSNYSDTRGSSTSKYQVAAVVRGVEQPKCSEVTRWGAQYKDIQISSVTNRNGKDVTSKYEINDISLGDVNGDGVAEFIVKRNNTGGDLNTSGNKTDFNHYECYTMKGERLWWIDLGPNLMAGPDEQWDLVSFDWDRDGKAECVMRGADNMIIHTASGKEIRIGNMNYYAPRDEYTHQGAEYLLYLNGETGEPYGWDGADNWTPMAYPLPRFEAGEAANPLNATSGEYEKAWGKADTGHRSSKHYFGAPFLDGRKASIFLGRGCYTRHKMCALDVDPLTHQLTQRWRWDNNGGWGDPWFGNGYHNFAIADTDWDGRDEIVFGSMIIDDNGHGLCTTGLGHGDAQHCADLDPYRHGQEQFTCNEDEPSCTYYNATTGQIYYRLQGTSDDGRALAGNFSNSFPGSMGRSVNSALVSCVADKVIEGGPATGDSNDALFWSHLNQRIYWDGDLLDEVFDSPGSAARSGAIYKPGGGRLITMDGTNTANSSKNNAGAIADLLGDWREEVVMRNGTQGSKTIRIFTTNTPTAYSLYTLWHDHQYRNAMVWQCVGYNQPPHKSYFVGQMEGITIAPPPLTMTDRTEVKDGGTIDATLDDRHVIVCETADTKVSVADGARPYIATFNVPSWVQGTNSGILNGGAKINYQYYTCDVSGGAFTGPMRLVKQGDGVLNLPAVDMTYTGETNIWAGTVNFDGRLLSSSLWLNRFAELNSDGGQFRSIRMDYDAKLRPGRAGHRGSVTTDSLLLGFGARVVFDLYGDLTADEVNTRLLTVEAKNWKYGPKYLTPVFEFVVNDAADGQVAEGKYLLGTVGELTGSLDNIRLEGLSTQKKAELMIEDGKLYLNVSGVRDAGAVVWNGLTSNIWELAGEPNFTSAADESVTGDIFVSGDNVRFDDTAAKFSVTMKGDIETDTIEVDNTKAYTFTGTGAIVGQSVLVKRGTGTLTVNTDNSYTGGNRLSGGVVSIKSLANANQAMGNLGGVTTTPAIFVMENGAELRTTAAVTQGSPMQMAGDEGGVINNSQDFILNKPVSGTVMTKKGGGWMKLNTSNGALNRLVVMAGTVQCVNANIPAKTVEFQGGTLSENTSSSYTIHVAEGKTGTWNMANRSTYTNKITGKGTLNANCVTEKGTNYYATRTPVRCNFTDFEGTLKPSSNVDDPSVLRFTMDTGGSMAKGTMNIASNVEVQNSGKTFRIGRVTGSGKLGGSCTFSNGTTVGANTWQVGNDEDWTTNVKVSANANFVKVGGGKVTWNGASSNTGTTTVREGELCMGSLGQLGTGRLTVNEGATLSGTNLTSKQLTNASVIVNGTLRPGTTADATTGTLRFGGKNVTVNATGQLVIRTAGANSATSLSDIGTLTVNGTIVIQVADNHTLKVGDEIRLWPETVTLAGEPLFDMQGGISWDTSRLSEGILVVKEIATGLNPALADTDPQNVYDLQGRLVRRQATAASTEGLPSGIYLRAGRKVVVK